MSDMDYTKLFHAKTEEELNECVASLGGVIETHQVTETFTKYKMEVSKGKYVEVEGKKQPTEAVYFAKFHSLTLRISCFASMNRIRVMEIEEL